MEGVAKTHRALIARYQPYHPWKMPGYSGPIAHPLAVLNDLSNDDKHRTTQPHFIAAKSGSFKITRYRDVTLSSDATVTDIFNRPLERGAEFFRCPMKVTGQHPDVNVQVELSLSVCLRDGMPANGMLNVIEAFCRKVVTELTPIFETRKAHRLDGLSPIGRFAAPPAPGTVVVTGKPATPGP